MWLMWLISLKKPGRLTQQQLSVPQLSRALLVKQIYHLCSGVCGETKIPYNSLQFNVKLFDTLTWGVNSIVYEIFNNIICLLLLQNLSSAGCQLKKYRMPRFNVTEMCKLKIMAPSLRYSSNKRPSIHKHLHSGKYNPFYPYETLPVYCVAPLWFAAVGFLCSMGGAANLTAAIIGLIFDVPFLATYCQNEVVNRRSLPIVMKQKTVDNLPTLNALYGRLP